MRNKEKVIVTGCAGFVGFHLSRRLLDQNYEVYGIDNLNNYYDVVLKENRLKILIKYKNFTFFKENISKLDSLTKIFKETKPAKVVSLAAQAGVRYSIEDPHSYIESNIKGFMNVLECCRYNKVKGLIYASSSSVYGKNNIFPFSETDKVDKPISIYAVTKKTNELMAYTYSHLYGLKTTGLRFFTIYGPWGRPDMAIYLFLKKILDNKKIEVFNNGNMQRDFTYIEDAIEGICLAIKKNKKCEVFNIANNKMESILEVISLLEKSLSKKSQIKLMKMQPGDVKKTDANIEHTQNKLGFDPKVNIAEGIPLFVSWYKKYHRIK